MTNFDRFMINLLMFERGNISERFVQHVRLIQRQLLPEAGDYIEFGEWLIHCCQPGIDTLNYALFHHLTNGSGPFYPELGEKWALKLIEAGANINAWNPQQIYTSFSDPEYTLLHHVIREKDTALLNWVLAHGGDINFGGPKMHTPLFRCVDRKDVESTERALQYGAKLTIPVPEGLDEKAEKRNALHCILSWDKGQYTEEHLQMLALLLEHATPIDLEFENEDGQTPLEALIDDIVYEFLCLRAKRWVPDESQTNGHILTVVDPTPSVNGMAMMRLFLKHGAAIREDKYSKETIPESGPDSVLKMCGAAEVLRVAMEEREVLVTGVVAMTIT